MWRCSNCAGISSAVSSFRERPSASLLSLYGTGRASARTALQRLTQQGLVAPVPRRGYIITRMTIGDVREIFELRLALEPLAARLATGRADCRMMMKREEEALAAWRARRCRHADVLEHNRFIHMHVAEASGNGRLARRIDELLGESERSISIGLRNGSLTGRMTDEHMLLIEALQSGDADLAEERAREHVSSTMRNVMDALLNSPAILSQPIDGAQA
jgi:DNA-binding GntR family transcriptional regulator